MIQSISITLYGSRAACACAKALLENMPKIHRLSDNAGTLLLQSDALTENELIAVLAPSGISGFKLSTAIR